MAQSSKAPDTTATGTKAPRAKAAAPAGKKLVIVESPTKMKSIQGY